MKIKKLTKKIIMDLDYNPKEIEMCLAWHPALGIIEGARLESVFTGSSITRLTSWELNKFFLYFLYLWTSIWRSCLLVWNDTNYGCNIFSSICCSPFKHYFLCL